MALRTPLIALSAVTLLSGCSAFRNYDSELAQTNQQLATGNVDAALTCWKRTTPAPTKICSITSRKVSCCAPG
jgi:CO dehydrogenase/acetyl-CoA synthase beta subunit